MLDLLRFVRLVDRHEPGLAEAAATLSWSIAKVKRVVTMARAMGMDMPCIRPKNGGPHYYKLVTWGPLDMRHCRTLYDKDWL